MELNVLNVNEVAVKTVMSVEVKDTEVQYLVITVGLLIDISFHYFYKLVYPT
jgi:hypothetical protein